MIDRNVELRRSMISSVFDKYRGTPGFIVHHKYQGGTVITIVSRDSEESKMLKKAIGFALRKNLDNIEVENHDEEGYYYRGSRIRDDFKALGLHIVGSFPFDIEGKIEIYDTWPELVRNKGSDHLNVFYGPDEQSSAIFDRMIPQIRKVGYLLFLEEELYADLLLDGGTVRSSVTGICQVPTGEYVTQTVCTDCGRKTGACRAADDFEEILDIKSATYYCESCALRHLDCSVCTYYGACEENKKPSNCDEFEFADLDFEDDTLCSCPLGGY